MIQWVESLQNQGTDRQLIYAAVQAGEGPLEKHDVWGLIREHKDEMAAQHLIDAILAVRDAVSSLDPNLRDQAFAMADAARSQHVSHGRG